MKAHSQQRVGNEAYRSGYERTFCQCKTISTPEAQISITDASDCPVHKLQALGDELIVAGAVTGAK